MDKSGFVIGALVAVIAGLVLRYRRIVRNKNRSIMHHINERDKMEKAMERTIHKYVINKKTNK